MPSPILLCIDDRPELLKLRKSTLEPLGYSVATATDPSSAIKLLESTPVAAVLIDYKSEGMDTEAVAWHIKQRFSDKPIVLLSAYSDLPERILWLVDEYVMRSEPVKGLVQVIERVTGRSPLRTAKKFPPRSENALARNQEAC